MSSGNGNTNGEELFKLPASVQEAVRRSTGDISVEAVAPFDLSPQGTYIEGYLVLADDRLGQIIHTGQQWEAQWLTLEGIRQARIIEGLGMSLLRLLRDGHIAAEYRFTLRNAKNIARLHRRLERKIDGQANGEDQLAEAEFPRQDEKKLRCEKCGRVIPPWAETCPACLNRRKVLSRLLDFVKPYKGQAITGFALSIIVTLAGLAKPYFTKPMLNEGLGASKNFSPDYGVLMYYVVLMTGLTVLTALGTAWRQRLMSKLAAGVAKDVREKTYEHLHKLSLSFFSRRPTGSLVTRITSDSDRIWDFVAFTLIEVIVTFLTIFGVGAALFILNWRLASIVLLPIPVMTALTIFFHRRMRGYFKQIFHRWSQLTSVVADALPGMRVIKAFSQEKREVERFHKRNIQYYEGECRIITLWTLFGPLLQLCSQVGVILVWAVGGYWVVKGYHNMDPGTLMAYMGYMWMFYGPIHMISHMDRMFNRAATSVQRIFEILDTEPTIFSKSQAVLGDKLQGRIELRNVSFSYDGVRRVLKDINLEIQSGEIIGLAGPSGGGKTTLVNLLCRFYDVMEGQILIDGIDLRDYDLVTLRRRIGVVLQEPFLFYGSVSQNIAYGNPDTSIDQIIESAKAANAHDFIVGFPDGYDTMVGERGQSLSGGERQRISIARAVLTNPRILILDEATSSVDTETEMLIQEALDRLIANRTTIAIAHRLSTLRKTSRIIVLEKGEIKEQGTHNELAAMEEGIYAKLLNKQTQLQSVIAITG